MWIVQAILFVRYQNVLVYNFLVEIFILNFLFFKVEQLIKQKLMMLLNILRIEAK